MRPREFASKWRPNSTVPAGGWLEGRQAVITPPHHTGPTSSGRAPQKGVLLRKKCPNSAKSAPHARRIFFGPGTCLRVLPLRNERVLVHSARFVSEKWDERGFWAHLWLYGAKLFKYRRPLATNIFLRLILFTQITRIPERAAEIFSKVPLSCF